MKQLKRVFAFLLTLCMIFSLLPAMSAPAAAADNTFNITGINAYNFRTSDWYIILNVDNADFSLSAVASLVTAGVTVDGEVTTGGWFQVGTGTLAFTLATDKAAHKVVFPAGMQLGNFTLENEYVFFTQADGSVKQSAKFTGVNNYNFRTSDWYIILNTDRENLSLPAVASLATAGVTIDGTVTTGGWFQVTSGNEGKVAFTLATDKADHRVVIPAGTVLGNYVLAEDYVFFTYADGSVSTGMFNITGINAYNYRTSDFYIILGTDNAKFNLTAVASLATSGTTNDGAAASGWFQIGTGTLAFTLVTDKAEHKVILPKGMELGGFVLESEYVFYTHSTGYVDNIAPFQISGIKAYNFRGSDWYIVLNTNNPDFNLSAVASLATAGVTVDDAATSGWFQVGEGTLAFTLATDKAEHKVVLPAGMQLGNFILTEAYTFYTHTDGSVNTTAPKVNITGIGGYNYRTNNSDWYIILNVDDSNFALSSVASLEAAGVTVDGEVTSGWFQATTGTLEFTLVTDKANHEVVIPAGTVLGKYTLENDYVFYTHADGSVNTTKPVEYVNITGIQNYNYRDANSDWYIILNTDREDFALSSAVALNATIDGAAASGWFQATTGTLEFTLVTDKANHEVVIPAGTVLGKYTLENDYVFYTHADGSVNTTKPVEYVNITGIQNYNYRDANSDWYIILNTDREDFALSSAVALNATVDGAAASGWFQATTGTLEFTLVTDKANHEVVIPAGTVLGDFVLENDYTFYTHADGAVNTTKPVEYVNITGIQNYNYRTNNSDWYIILNTDREDFALTSAVALNATIDGEAASGWFQVGTGTLAFTLVTDKAEHYVVIPAGTVLGDFVLESDYAFYTHASGAVDTQAPKVNITGIKAYNFRGSDWYIVLNVDDSNFALSAVASLAAAGVTVDGEVTSGWFQPTTGTLEFTLTTDKAEHKIVIPAGITLGDYTLESEYVFYTHADSSVDTTPQVNITEISGGYNNQYIVYLTTDKAITLTANQAVTLNLDGESISAWLNMGEIPFLSFAAEMGEHMVVIPVGTQLGDSALAADYTFYTHADGSMDQNDPTADETVYQTVTVTALDEQGVTVLQRSVRIGTNDIYLVEQELAAYVADGKVLLGYTYGEELYASLANISVTGLDAVQVTLKTVDFTVQAQPEIRHGDGLTDSGLRFVATLGQTEYIPKMLLAAESLEDLSVAAAPYKIGNPYHTEESPFIEIQSIDDTISYSIAIANISATDYNKTYYACAGILVEYADIGQNYVYTDAVSSTVNEAALANHIASDVRAAYIDGVMALNADAALTNDQVSYTIEVTNNADGDYVISYTGSTVQIQALTIEGMRLTAADGVVFGENVITVPNGLFAAAKLNQEIGNGKINIAAYKGPSVGRFQYTEEDGTVTDSSFTRTHDAVYADVCDYFAAGINVWMAEDWTMGGTYYSENDALSALDLAAEYCINNGLTKADIQVLIADPFINGLLSGTDMNNGDRNSISQYTAIAQDRINTLINYNPVVNGVEVGTEYNCFAGLVLRDEPNYSHMDYYVPWFNYLAADEDQTATVTAWNTAGEEISDSVNCLGLLSKGYTLHFSLLGMSASKTYIVADSTSSDVCTEAEYLAYLSRFIDGVNETVWNYSNMTVCFDNYGLYTNASTAFMSTKVTYSEQMSANWQQNMALIAELTRDKSDSAVFSAAIRSFAMERKGMASFWTAKTWKEFKAFDEAWGEQAVSMQLYTALAHGYRDISYYAYWESDIQGYDWETYTDACVMWDENMNPVKQNMYYWVQSANQELAMIENIITSFDYEKTAAIASGDSFYTGTATVGDSGKGSLWTASQLVDSSALASISSTVDTTAGYFTKDSGEFNQMIMLVNMSHPMNSTDGTVTMSFDSGYTGIIVYADGQASIYQLTDGQVTLTVPSGEGVVVIPVQ